MSILIDSSNISDKDFLRRRNNALAISLALGILFFVTGIASIMLSIRVGASGLITVAVNFILSIFAFVSAWLSYRNRVASGAYLLIASLVVISLVFPFIAHGQGVVLGIVLLVIVTGISTLSLNGSQTVAGIIAGILGSISLILLDLYLPDFGLPNNPLYINIFSALVTTAFIVVIFRQFGSYALRVKLVLGFLAATVFPLAILGYLNYRTTANILLSEANSQLTNLSISAASTIDNYLNGQINAIQTEGKQITLIDYVELDPLIRPNSLEETNASFTLSNDLRKDPIFIRSFGILDRNGRNILDTNKENQGKNESTAEYFTQPNINGLPYVSNLVFHDGKTSIYFSSPIKDRGGKVIGILRQEVDAKILQTLIGPLVSGNNNILIAVVDRETYIRIAFTGDREKLFKSYNNFTAPEIAIMQAQGRIAPGSKDDAIAGADPVVVSGINNINFQPSFTAYSISLNDNAINVGTSMNRLPWVVVGRESVKAHLIPITEQTRNGILVSILMVAGSIIIALLATNIVTAPIVALSQIAESISRGDLGVRADIATEDEIGILAGTFNRMTDELKQSVGELEQRVAERTADLETARQQSEKRSRELQAIGEISSIITSEQRTENLLPLITRLVSERFDFYHVGIFLVDETKQFAHLKASNSPGGQRMLARGHKLEVGETGIVGLVTSTGKPRIALDVGSDSIFFNNPDLPETHSEMALPLIARGVLIGALDVQSIKPNAFAESDVKVLAILADQVATAIENAGLFERTQNALNEVQSIYGQFLKEQWALFAQQEEQVGYFQGSTGGKKLSNAIQKDEIKQVMNQGKMLVTHGSNGSNNGQAQIIVPIKLRGQVIGVVNVNAPSTNREWNQDEINLTEAVSERMALALENARLLEESQIRAAKEQVIGEVTSRIGASINMRSVLQTAAEELGRALPGSEIVIQLQNEEEKE